MVLSTGTRLGPYEILSPLGAGGMGEVYRARDTKLGREVAIKVLPDVFTKDAERLARFEREAQVLASLNHPNIGAIHGLEESNGTRFLVLELVQGDTLAELIQSRDRQGADRGSPLGIEEALKICRQIAEALEAAHEKGVIHRDLKPANVKVTPQGKVKVLDFGLAKAFAPDESSPSVSLSPTLTLESLRSGVILGTAAYMSPEQARGKPLDKRTDVWSFGCVLSETLTSRQAFGGETVSDTIARILEREPDLAAVPPNTPAIIQALLRRCLHKDRNLRLHDIADARIEIDEALAQLTSPQIEAGAAAAAPRRNRERLAWTLVSVLLLVVLALATALTYVYLRHAPEDVRPVSSFILPPEKTTFDFIGSDPGPVVVSPDGRRLAFAAKTREGKRLLWIRPLGAFSAQPLSGTEGASFPFWSPDSRYLGFYAGGKLKKIEAPGGPAQTLCRAPTGRTGAWNRDGVILFTPTTSSPLYRVSASGGAATAVTQFNEPRHENTHRWPYFLPDGRHFLYLAAARGHIETSGIHVGSLDSKEDKLLLNAYSNAAYAQGYLLFMRERTLMAQPLDDRRLTLTGDAFPIAEQVQFNASNLGGIFSVSDNGVLAYQTGTGLSGAQLVWLDRGGKQIGSIKELGTYAFPRLSPDGQRLAVRILDPSTGNFDIWVHELSRPVRTRFTFDPSIDSAPIWSPDGTRIVFASNRRGPYDLYQKTSSGAGKEELLFQSDGDTFPADWSLDGRFIVYYHADPKGNEGWDLWILPLLGDRKPFPFLATEFNEAFGQFAPNGRWIAYASDESGNNEVYVAPFPGAGSKWRVSTSGGSEPRWRRDGKELFYLASDNKLVAVEIKEKGSRLEAGAVRPLFETRPSRTTAYSSYIYDVSSDGKRFLVCTTVGDEPSTPITLVVNWTAGVKR